MQRNLGVLISQQILSEVFLVLRRIQRDNITHLRNFL